MPESCSAFQLMGCVCRQAPAPEPLQPWHGGHEQQWEQQSFGDRAGSHLGLGWAGFGQGGSTSQSPSSIPPSIHSSLPPSLPRPRRAQLLPAALPSPSQGCLLHLSVDLLVDPCSICQQILAVFINGSWLYSLINPWLYLLIISGCIY